jgi:hypothetical protein
MTVFVALTEMAKVWRRHVAESFCGSSDLHGLPPSAVTHKLSFSFRTPNTSTCPALLEKREQCIGVAPDPVRARLLFPFLSLTPQDTSTRLLAAYRSCPPLRLSLKAPTKYHCIHLSYMIGTLRSREARWPIYQAILASLMPPGRLCLCYLWTPDFVLLDREITRLLNIYLLM